MQRRTILEPSKYSNPVNFTMSPAAWRARRPYFWKNVAIASALTGLVGGIYFLSARAFKPDDFGDVPIPPMSEEQIAALKEEQERLINKHRNK